MEQSNLAEVTATRLAGAAATLRTLAEKIEGPLQAALYFLADAVEESVREIDAACDPG